MKTRWLILLVPFVFGCQLPNPFLEEDLLQHPPAKRCADCHMEIYKQWTKSRHSKAFISETYKTATDNYSKPQCLSCHIPKELSKGKEPEPRTSHLSDGVNCVSCHFSSKDMAIHGPYDVFSPPHPSKKDEDFTKSYICSSCHRQTYKQWQTSGSHTSCQHCHMTPVKKADLIQKFPFDLFHRAKLVYNHQFPTGIASHLKLNLHKERTTLVLTVLNDTVPHNIPTADNGNPKYILKVEIFKNGNLLDSDTKIITPKFAIPFKQPKKIQFDFWDDFDKAKLYVYRKLSWQKEKQLVKMIEKTF